MDEYFQEDNITDADAKKARIVRYTSANTEEEWKALTHFSTGTYDEFKSDILDSYPTVKDRDRGSITNLKRKIRNVGTVGMDDKAGVSALIRAFNAEKKKLEAITPAIHTNKELCLIFLDQLTTDFATEVMTRLKMQLEVKRSAPAAANAQNARNANDLFDIADVLKMASELSKEEEDPYKRYTKPRGIKGESQDTTVKLEETRQQLARLNDSVTLQNQHNRQMEQRMDQKFHTMMQYMNGQGQTNSTGPTFNASSIGNSVLPMPGGAYSRPRFGNTSQFGGAGQNMDKCFYCGQNGHRMNMCVEVQRDLDSKWLVRIDGRVRLPNGDPVPTIAGKTMRQVVEQLNKDKSAGKSVLFHEQPEIIPDRGQELTDAEAMRALTETFQRVGMERVQKILFAEAAPPQAQMSQLEEAENDPSFY